MFQTGWKGWNEIDQSVISPGYLPLKSDGMIPQLIGCNSLIRCTEGAVPPAQQTSEIISSGLLRPRQRSPIPAQEWDG
jgi:hypothetical protein